MSIKPAMGWLALLLFTTAAQAEGPRDLSRGAPKMSAKTPITAPVTPKTKGAPVPGAITSGTTPSESFVRTSSAVRSEASTIVESITKPRADYEADVHAGVALDSPVAKARGLDKGLVSMVFEQQHRPAFRVGRDRIKRVVRIAADERGGVALVRTSTAARPAVAKDHIDVLETDDGVVLVDTAVHGAGLFVTSDVYVFAKNATLDQRIGALDSVPAPVRARLREAMVAAEWAPAR